MTQSLLSRINAIQESKDNEELEKTQLIIIDTQNTLELFTNEEKIKDLINSATIKTRSLVPDVFTDKGRKDIASMAYSVARTKTYLDSIGKELVSYYKEVPKKIDSVRKFARDSLDSLRDEVRKPLDEWEAEQARLKLIEEIADCHIIALALNHDFDKAKADRLAEEERQRKEYEAIVRAQAEKDALERLERERLSLKLAHQKQLMMAEENRLKAIAQAEIEKAEAIIAERKRAEQQQQIIEFKKRLDEENKIKAEELKAQARQNLINDIRHRESIQLDVLNDLVQHSQISKEDAGRIINAIQKSLIPNLSINY